MCRICHCPSHPPQHGGQQGAPGNAVRGMRQINTRFPCTALGRQAGHTTHSWKHPTASDAQAAAARAGQVPSPTWKAQRSPQGPPTSPSALSTLELLGEGSALPPPKLTPSSPQWGPRSPTATECCHSEHGMEEYKGKFVFSSLRKGEQERQITTTEELGAWLTAWRWGSQRGKQREMWARVGEAPAGWGSQAMQELGWRPKAKAKEMATSGEESSHGQDWPPSTPEQGTWFMTALWLIPGPSPQGKEAVQL